MEQYCILKDTEGIGELTRSKNLELDLKGSNLNTPRDSKGIHTVTLEEYFIGVHRSIQRISDREECTLVLRDE